MKRRNPRWKTRFGSFVSRHTVARLCRDLNAALGYPTHESTVYGWIRGDSCPRPDRALAIVAASGGRLRVEDLLQHRREVRDADGNRTRPQPLARGAA